ncbi:hypothetical protein FB451DRAFT_1175266 [Mycena latifolia]|nr:hypothetical protein FB451DRAFT_1175266 [Mycena latifolia]
MSLNHVGSLMGLACILTRHVELKSTVRKFDTAGYITTQPSQNLSEGRPVTDLSMEQTVDRQTDDERQHRHQSRFDAPSAINYQSALAFLSPRPLLHRQIGYRSNQRVRNSYKVPARDPRTVEKSSLCKGNQQKCSFELEDQTHQGRCSLPLQGNSARRAALMAGSQTRGFWPWRRNAADLCNVPPPRNENTLSHHGGVDGTAAAQMIGVMRLSHPACTGTEVLAALIWQRADLKKKQNISLTLTEKQRQQTVTRIPARGTAKNRVGARPLPAELPSNASREVHGRQWRRVHVPWCR